MASSPIIIPPIPGAETMITKTIEYKVSFNTPAFLGNAEQQAQRDLFIDKELRRNRSAR
jgi:hypothetical protein